MTGFFLFSCGFAPVWIWFGGHSLMIRISPLPPELTDSSRSSYGSVLRTDLAPPRPRNAATTHQRFRLVPRWRVTLSCFPSRPSVRLVR